ncbi:MAG: long-chain fatty acid--CoA ligase [Myxococcales bacterium]|nr:long-chain fatty acid--CoA ligase [Myxococcales bacterium]
MTIHRVPSAPTHEVASESRTVGEMFARRARHSASRPAMYAKQSGASGWELVTWRAVHERARSAARGLRALGVARGERVAILGPTQPPWAVYDMAAQLAGMVSFGIYPKQSVEQVRYLLEHADARVVLVEGEGELDTVLAAAQGLDVVAAIVPWTHELYERAASRDARLRSPRELEGEPLSEAEVDASLAAVDPDDTAILIYTSGTTGPPKGAMISHRSILTLLADAASFLPLDEADLSMNFLPMAHAAERVLGFYGRIANGLATAYASSMGAVLQEVQEVRPTLFGAVPRIFEKAHAKIHGEVQKQSQLVQRIFAWASAVGKESVPYRTAGRPMPLALRVRVALADRLVFRKIRGAFGGRVRQFVTGAAPISLDILEFFWGAGLEIYEAFGMTEATVVTHINRPGAVSLGTVGRPIGRMEQRIAEDGEVLLRGPFVFKGYFKDAEATAAMLQDGWLHTGDIGSVDAEGYLRITDRKKHLIITSGGKNIAPANIEKAIKSQDPLISQVHAHGDRRPYVAALLAPSPLEALEWGAERGLVTKDELAERTRELLDNPASRSEALNALLAKVVAHPELGARLARAVRAGNRQLAQVEQVRRFAVLDRDFSQEHGELTPTLKLKRKFVEQKFEPLFERLYADPSFGFEP